MPRKKRKDNDIDIEDSISHLEENQEDLSDLKEEGGSNSILDRYPLSDYEYAFDNYDMDNYGYEQ